MRKSTTLKMELLFSWPPVSLVMALTLSQCRRPKVWGKRLSEFPVENKDILGRDFLPYRPLTSTLLQSNYLQAHLYHHWPQCLCPCGTHRWECENKDSRKWHNRLKTVASFISGASWLKMHLWFNIVPYSVLIVSEKRRKLISLFRDL